MLQKIVQFLDRMKNAIDSVNYLLQNGKQFNLKNGCMLIREGEGEDEWVIMRNGDIFNWKNERWSWLNNPPLKGDELRSSTRMTLGKAIEMAKKID